MIYFLWFVYVASILLVVAAARIDRDHQVDIRLRGFVVGVLFPITSSYYWFFSAFMLWPILGALTAILLAVSAFNDALKTNHLPDENELSADELEAQDEAERDRLMNYRFD